MVFSDKVFHQRLVEGFGIVIQLLIGTEEPQSLLFYQFGGFQAT